MNLRSGFLCVLFVVGATPLHAQYRAVNMALTLNGSSYMSVANHDDFGSTLASGGKMSIDAWVFPASITGTATIVGNGYSVGYWLGIDSKGNVVFKPNSVDQYVSNAALSTGTWTHVAATYDVFAQTAKIYINGVLDKSVSFLQGYIEPGSADLRIGADMGVTGGPAFFWRGYIDEVRIWNAALDFSTASGLLYRIPHGVVNGRWGKYLVTGWRLNGTTAEITQQHTGTLVGGASFDTSPDPPHYDNIGAVMFNKPGAAAPGTQDYFMVRTNSLLSLVQNYTLECWVKPSALYGDTQYQTFIQKGSKYAGSYTYWLGLRKSNNRAYFVPHGNFTTGLESSISLPMGQWSHVAARYSTSGNTHTATIFINGVPRGLQTYTILATPNTHPMYIGRADGPNAPPDAYGYSGVIDEVRIWGAARSDDQIADNYLLRYNGPQAGLNAVYRFDGDILDHSGYGNNGDHTLDNLSDVYFESTMTMPDQPSVTVLSPNGGETLPIGQVYKIKWQSTGLINASIFLSRDGGSSFANIVPSVSASAGEYDWTVTGPETPDALIRITTPSPTSVADTSDNMFTIAPAPRLEVTPGMASFAAAQNGPLPAAQILQAVNIGSGNIAWTATWTSPAWLNVSPVNQTGNTTSVSVSVLTTGIPEGLYTDTITFTGNMDNSPVLVPVEYTVTSKRLFSVAGIIRNAPGTAIPVSMEGIAVSATGPVTKSVWTNVFGEFALNDLPEGDYIIKPDDPMLSFSPAQRAYTPLSQHVSDANFDAEGVRGTVTLEYQEGWNLLSIPLEMTETALTVLIPDALPPAYSYDQMTGYVIASDLVFGPGYWVKCSRTGTVQLTGILKRSLEFTLLDVNGGWNLVGTPSAVSDLAHILQAPANSIMAMYDFFNSAGYIPPLNGFIYPGRAYWVKTGSPATMWIVPASMGASALAKEIGFIPGATVQREGEHEP